MFLISILGSGLLVAGVFGTTDLFSVTIGSGFFCDEDCFAVSLLSTAAITLPIDTLSPTLTFSCFIIPETGDGTSMLDLSLSRLRIGSFLFI